MRCAIIILSLVAALAAIPRASAQEDVAATLKRLEAKIAALEQRVEQLEAELAEARRPKPTITIEARGPNAPAPKPEKKEDPLALNQPLTDAERAAITKAMKAVDTHAVEVRKYGAQLSPTAGLARDAVVDRWAKASKELVELYADYGQEKACLTALARFSAWRTRTYGAVKIFDEAAYNCGSVLLSKWENADSAMRLAARYGPTSRWMAGSWGKLCEEAAVKTKKRSTKMLALKCYRRAAVVGNDQGAWQRVNALEAELRPAGVYGGPR